MVTLSAVPTGPLAVPPHVGSRLDQQTHRVATLGLLLQLFGKAVQASPLYRRTYATAVREQVAIEAEIWQGLQAASPEQM